MENYKCPHCGNSVFPLDVSCRFCLKYVRSYEEMNDIMDGKLKVCNFCAVANESSNNYCKNCGNALSSEAKREKEEMENGELLYQYAVFKLLKRSSQKDITRKIKVVDKMSKDEIYALAKEKLNEEA